MQIEKKYNEPEEKLTKTLESMDKMTQYFDKYEERISETQVRIMVIVEKQIDDANARQNTIMRAQLEDMYTALSKKLEKNRELQV